MTDTPTKLLVNCETGEQVVVPFTAEEIADANERAEAWLAEKAKLEAEIQAQAEIKASALAKLQTLGLTEDEAVALLG